MVSFRTEYISFFFCPLRKVCFKEKKTVLFQISTLKSSYSPNFFYLVVEEELFLKLFAF